MVEEGIRFTMVEDVQGFIDLITSEQHTSIIKKRLETLLLYNEELWDLVREQEQEQERQAKDAGTPFYEGDRLCLEDLKKHLHRGVEALATLYATTYQEEFHQLARQGSTAMRRYVHAFTQQFKEDEH